MSYVYDLPVFTRRGLAHTLLGNWQISGLTTYQTGIPFSVVNGLVNDNAGVGNSSLIGTGGGLGSYADVIGDPRSKQHMTFDLELVSLRLFMKPVVWT